MVRKSREEIVATLNRWVEEGEIVSKIGLNLPYAEVDRRVAKGELLLTLCEGVLCYKKEVKAEFDKLFVSHRILSSHGCRVHKNLLTLYAIEQAVTNGSLARVDLPGRKTILYID